MTTLTMEEQGQFASALAHLYTDFNMLDEGVWEPDSHSIGDCIEQLQVLFKFGQKLGIIKIPQLEDLREQDAGLPNPQIEIISDMANAIVNARDFCGDERLAAIDAAAEHNVKATSDMLSQAFAKANGTWRESQRAAGVKQKYWR